MGDGPLGGRGPFGVPSLVGSAGQVLPLCWEDVLRSSLGRGRPLVNLSCSVAILCRNSWEPWLTMSYILREMCWMNSSTDLMQMSRAITSFKTYRTAPTIIRRAMFCWA
ncbi:hypothetical protein EVAR_72717_1 [Eumeta japonica]|uniref:Uncharacterized protein n=1 Tax=Eumeta variegata TaxID=151549 RepID=A0A4C1SIV1_EUMVA|nr:hypothetical protein EVAR_72717_1 [Eumeta japonica]